jgi:hypothetical protein
MRGTYRRPFSLQSIAENDMLVCEDASQSLASLTLESSHSSGSPLSRRYTDGRLDFLAASSHLGIVQLIQHERSVRGLPPFILSKNLNRLAIRQAITMAKFGVVCHTVSTVEELQKILWRTLVAENVLRGVSALQMHRQTMQMHTPTVRMRTPTVQRLCPYNPLEVTITRSNVLNPHFNEFGCGVALGQDGKLYCCQLFRNGDCKAH